MVALDDERPQNVALLQQIIPNEEENLNPFDQYNDEQFLDISQRLERALEFRNPDIAEIFPDRRSLQEIDHLIVLLEANPRQFSEPARKVIRHYLNIPIYELTVEMIRNWQQNHLQT